MRNFLKKISILLIVCSFLCSFPVSASGVLFPEHYKVILCESSMTGIADGEISVLPVVPSSKDGNLMLPVRYVFENLGYTVSYDNGIVTLSGKNTIILEKDSDVAVVNNEKVTLGKKSEILDGTFMVSEEICGFTEYSATKTTDGLFIIHSGKYEYKYDENLMMLQGVYMSVSGADIGKATPKNPVKDMYSAIEGIKKRIELYGNQYIVNVFVEGGIYRIEDTIKFKEEIFGDESHKGVVFRGYNGEAVFSGSALLPSEMLKPVTDPLTLARIPKSARGKVAYIDLKAVGIADKFNTGQSYAPYVYVNDIMQIESRWPNDGYAKVASVPVLGKFTVEEENVKNWTTATEAQVSGFMNADYERITRPITNVDADNYTVTISGTRPFQTTRSGARYFVKNLLEEVDVPGEWFVDRSAGILYFYPPYTMKDSKFEITTLIDKNMFDISNTQGISFHNITFEKVSGAAIWMPGADNICVTKCKFENITGDFAIAGHKLFTDTTYPVDNITIDGNLGWMLGRGFAILRTGDINTLEHGNSKVTNNRSMCGGIIENYGTNFLDIGTNYPDREASCGWYIANNLVQDSETANSLNIPGVDILVENNEFLNIANSINDGGVVYNGRANSLYNVEVKNNYVHHLNKDNDYVAYYNDDGYAGANWHHNIAYSVHQLAILGSGMDMNVNYNLVIDASSGAGIGSRMHWTADTFGNDGALHNEVKKVISNYPAYSERFPQLVEALRRDKFFAPWNSSVYGNVGVNDKGVEAMSAQAAALSELKQYGADSILENGKTVDISELNATAEGNPGYKYKDEYFIDPSSQNWNINPESELAEKHPELLKIDINKIGISEGYEYLLDLEKDFMLRYPSNGQTGVQPKEIRFSWDPVKGASEYRLIVATDREMKNIVFDETQKAFLNNNACTVTSLTLDTVYYWKIEAIGLARQDTFTVGNIGGPFSFKTAKQHEVIRENLKLAISSLEKLLNDIDDGGYKYEDAFFEKADSLLKKAREVESLSNIQAERDAIEEEIYLFIKTSSYYMIMQYNEPEFLTDTSTPWSHYGEYSGKYTFAKVEYKNGEVVVTGTDADSLFATAKTAYSDNIISFSAKFEDLQPGNYQGFYHKIRESRKEGYLFVVKGDVLEFQTSQGNYFKAVPNDIIKQGEWHDYEFGAIPTPAGVLIIYAVDGNIIFSRLDTEPDRTDEGGRFGVKVITGSSISMKPMEKLPENKSLIERVYSALEKPYSESHLESLLIGLGPVFGIDSVFYNSLDKSKLANKLYPHLKDGKIKINENDTTLYKDKVMEYSVLEGYNQSKSDYIIKNSIEHVYPEYINIEKMDENNRYFYKFMMDEFMDNNIALVHSLAMGGDCKDFEELRKSYAKAIFRVGLNGCSAGIFGGATYYMDELLKKENMDYIGVNIDDYYNLSAENKNKVKAHIGRSGIQIDRSLEEIVEDINKKTAELSGK